MGAEAILGASYAVTGLLFVASYFHYRKKLNDVERALHAEEAVIHVWLCCFVASAYAIAILLH